MWDYNTFSSYLKKRYHRSTAMTFTRIFMKMKVTDIQECGFRGTMTCVGLKEIDHV